MEIETLKPKPGKGVGAKKLGRQIRGGEAKPLQNSCPASREFSEHVTQLNLALSETMEDDWPARSANIRLVILSRGSGVEPIRCDIIDDGFASKPVLEALSYEWGVPPNHKPIVINERAHYVRRNLYDALLHLRMKEKERQL